MKLKHIIWDEITASFDVMRQFNDPFHELNLITLMKKGQFEGIKP